MNYFFPILRLPFKELLQFFFLLNHVSHSIVRGLKCGIVCDGKKGGFHNLHAILAEWTFDSKLFCIDKSVHMGKMSRILQVLLYYE